MTSALKKYISLRNMMDVITGKADRNPDHEPGGHWHSPVSPPVPDWELNPQDYKACDACSKPTPRGGSDCIHCGNGYWYDDDGRRV
jgi:hypothetical protein